MNSHHLSNHLLQPPELLRLLYLSFIQEQPIIEKMNQIADELKGFLIEHFSSHLQSHYNVSIFTLDKSRASLIHKNVIDLHRITLKPFKNINDCHMFLNLLNDINANENCDSKIRIKIDELDTNFLPQLYDRQKNICDYLLAIIVYHKSMMHDAQIKEQFKSESYIPFNYHLLKIEAYCKLIQETCLNIYKDSYYPDILADLITNDIKDLLELQNSPLLASLQSENTLTDKQIKTLTEMIEIMLQDTNRSKTATKEFVTKLKEPNGCVDQILKYKAQKDTNALNKIFENDQGEGSAKLFDHYSLFIQYVKINLDISQYTQTFNTYVYQDFRSYFVKFTNMPPQEQEISYLILAIGNQFIERLKYLEETHFSDLLHEELTDNQSKLFATQHQRRIEWYAARLNDNLNDNNDIFSQSDLINLVRVALWDYFIDHDLKALYKTFDEHSSKKGLGLHLKTNLNFDQFEAYQHHSVSVWKRTLTKAFNDFKTQLDNTLKMLKPGSELTNEAILLMRGQMILQPSSIESEPAIKNKMTK